tara:strand:+ start:526 stop:1104 length:579 start_codon:yes stop_codon:yes gene_type:complete
MKKQKLNKFSEYLKGIGLEKEANYLSNILDEEDVEGDMDMEVDMEAQEEGTELVEFDENEEMNPSMEDDIEESLSDLESGEEFSMAGASTSNFHCCPEAKAAMEFMSELASSEEEEDLSMELMEELDAFLGDKIMLMEEGGSKDNLCAFIEKGLSAMYCIGQASGVMDEDIADQFQFVADVIDEVCSELLEE